MAADYLKLCKLFVSELGIAGGSGPSKVEGQTGELLNVVRWVATADVQVQGLWNDWDFLWAEEDQTLAADAREIDPPSANDKKINLLDRQSLVFRPGETDHFHPQFLEWRTFRQRYEFNKRRTVKNPTHWTITPGGKMLLSHKMKESTPIHYEFWRKPVMMVKGKDTSLIPNDSVSEDGDDYPRIILLRAKLIYAEREDAPEIQAGALAEYADLLEKMESRHLPWMDGSRKAVNDADLSVEIP